MISFPVVRLTDEHFIHDDTQGPPVAQLVVSGLHEDLGGDVVWGPHGGISLGVTDRQTDGQWVIHVKGAMSESLFERCFLETGQLGSIAHSNLPL